MNKLHSVIRKTHVNLKKSQYIKILCTLLIHLKHFTFYCIISLRQGKMIVITKKSNQLSSTNEIIIVEKKKVYFSSLPISTNSCNQITLWYLKSIYNNYDSELQI